MIFEQDVKWGFFVNDIGYTKIDKNQEYPSKGHPVNYMFTWEKGRVLDEFHFVLITDGEGVFESKETGHKKISDGDGFLLFPGMWHRYKPTKNKGWTERWIGFSGTIATQFLNNGFFRRNQPFISKCNKTSILNYFNNLFQLFNDEPIGYQRMASGICIQLMAELYNIQQNGDEAFSNSIIQKTKQIMYDRIDQSINLEKIASDFGVSYSKLRIDFKKQTGTSPLQYYILLKIERAKELLRQTKLPQKEIAYTLGFESDHYFNRIFKQKTGITPKQFRNSTNAIDS